MPTVYAVLGAGRQGSCAAWALARFGAAAEVRLVDSDAAAAAAMADRINRLLTAQGLPALVTPWTIDAADPAALRRSLDGVSAALSALPYRLNPRAALAALAARACFADLGGNTAITREILTLDSEARAARVSLVPDCGLAPGLANSLAVAAMERLAAPREVHVWCGGLPRTPRPPLGYKLVFNIGGLSNEYTGKAVVLRQGKIVELDTLEEVETLEFPQPVGTVEGFLTSGGTSTCPWSFAATLETYEYKTVRYPGHVALMRPLVRLGFLAEEPVDVGGVSVVPRELAHRLLTPLIDYPGDEDLVVLRVQAAGRDGSEVRFEMLEYVDPDTGWTAMERTTAIPAAAVCILQARGDVAAGAVPLERAVPARPLLAEVRRMGLVIAESAKGDVRPSA